MAEMSVRDVFLRITAALDQACIGYMLSGSFASAHYGAPRSTPNIDLVIEATSAELRASSRRYRTANTTSIWTRPWKLISGSPRSM